MMFVIQDGNLFEQKRQHGVQIEPVDLVSVSSHHSIFVKSSYVILSYIKMLYYLILTYLSLAYLIISAW